MQSIILTVHHDNAKHILKIMDRDSPVEKVEQFQRNLRKLGQPDGVSWKILDGSLVDALIASSEF